jgi:hypothetical protein
LDEGQLREITSLSRVEIRKRTPPDFTTILLRRDHRADPESIPYHDKFENPRTLSKPNELSQGSKAEKGTFTILQNSGPLSIYPESIGPGTFTNPREVQIPESEACEQGRSLGGESVRITEHEQEYSAHG